MKRKRGAKAGYKKGKKKISVNVSTPASADADTADNRGIDGSDDIHPDSSVDIESPCSEVDKPSNVVFPADMATTVSMGKSGHGRVKVKIKSSRSIESSHTHSDVQTQHVANLSNTKATLSGQNLVMENSEDAYSDGLTSDIQTPTTGKSSRKSGSVKIISAGGLDSSTFLLQEKHFNNQISSVQTPSMKEIVHFDNERTMDSPATKKFAQREITRSPCLDSRYNENELKSALTVIKKVMKMDAAEPFNTPVDPVALGIPDYFDVIDNPMDFGTICNELDRGCKYLNSEDVFKDVEFIWNNCYKYNNKGDYIIDLMKRVKKNFLKYWTAAGLFSGIMSENAQAHHEKPHIKGKSPKHKRKGIRHHKSGCLCAVCVVRRRRKERISFSPENQIATNDMYMPNECKEECSPIGNPDSERTSSSLNQSLEVPRNAEIEDPEQEDTEIDLHTNGQAEIDKEGPNKFGNEHLNGNDINAPSRLMLVENLAHDDSSRPSQVQENDVSSTMQSDEQKNYMQGEVLLQDLKELERKQEVSSEMLEQIELYEGISRQENHMVLQACRTIFSYDQRSVWNGPHSLNRRFHVTSAGKSPIHDVLATFLKR